MQKDPTRQVLAANIRRLMAETGITSQEAVAKKAGMGQSTVSRLLLLDQGATVDMLDAIAKAFGVRPWELVSTDEERKAINYARMLLGPRVSNERAAEMLPPAPAHEPPELKREPKRAAPRRRKPGKRKGKNPPAP